MWSKHVLRWRRESPHNFAIAAPFFCVCGEDKDEGCWDAVSQTCFHARKRSGASQAGCICWPMSHESNALPILPPLPTENVQTWAL